MSLRPSWKLYAGLWLLMMALRQDFWYWRDPTLVFGVLPVGLAYQAGYSLLATLVMALLVRYCWPAHVDELEPGAAAERGEAAAP